MFAKGCYEDFEVFENVCTTVSVWKAGFLSLNVFYCSASMAPEDVWSGYEGWAKSGKRGKVQEWKARQGGWEFLPGGNSMFLR